MSSYQQPPSNTAPLLKMSEIILDRAFGVAASCPHEYEQIKGALLERGEVFDLTHLYDPDDELNF